MKNERIQEITSKAIEQLIAAANEGRTKALTRAIEARTEAVVISPTALPPTHRTLLPWALPFAHRRASRNTSPVTPVAIRSNR